MENNSKILKELFHDHPSLKGRLKREGKTGCLIYIGPQRGHVLGNPLIHISGEKRCMLLRRLMWEKYYGHLPKGKHIRMRCNQYCHEITHMYLYNVNAPYRPMPIEYINRIDEKILIAIRYYKGKVSPAAIAKVFSLEKTIILGIWVSKSNYMVSVPPKWYPDPKLESNVEEASMETFKRYLCSTTLKKAFEDTEKSHLEPELKKVVFWSLKGDSTRAISLRLGRTKGGILYMQRRGLVNLYRELGDLRWIKLFSRGNIYRWKLSPY
jgi:hypothetical protein